MNLHHWHGKINKIFFPSSCSQVFWPQKHKSKPFNSLPALYLLNYQSPFIPAWGWAIKSSKSGVQNLKPRHELPKPLLFHPLSFTNPSETSHDFCYWQTRCSPIAHHFHTTSICRQEKCCHTVQTGLLCGFQAGDYSKMPHTSLSTLACWDRYSFYALYISEFSMTWWGAVLLALGIMQKAILFLQQQIVCTPALFWLPESHGVGFPWRTERMNGRQLC